jgi:hypothetical protein
LRADAGVPSIRQMATQAAYGKSTISEALSGRRLPTWDVARKLVAALGGDDEEARKLWADLPLVALRL